MTVRNIESEPSASGSANPEYLVEKGTRKFDDDWKKKRGHMNTRQRLEKANYKMEHRKYSGENIQTVKLSREHINIPTQGKQNTPRKFETNIKNDAQNVSENLNQLVIHNTEQNKTEKDTVNAESILQTTEIYPEIHKNQDEPRYTCTEMNNSNKSLSSEI
ncbi:unnamed protein product [Mytilus coruscus]|uniref:Uncharacterized protein n=1 Tax=Mytilus coruscus TaxID=42192 RepID=A0A6J8E1W9_MYTCO|nr:unnamed protein product [Mytilus coruscus]